MELSHNTPAKIKIDRARTVLCELIFRIDDFLSKHPLKVVIEDDIPNAMRRYVFIQSKPIPVELSAVIGDIIHNIRSALDLTMVDIVKKYNPEKKNFENFNFIIRSSKKDFLEALSKIKYHLGDDALELLRDIEPYHGGNSDFYIINKLSNIDKHRAIIPVGAAEIESLSTIDLSILNLTFKITGQTILSSKIDNKSKKFPLNSGDIIYTTPLPGSAVLWPEISRDISLGIVIYEKNVIEGEPLVEILTHYCDLVEQIVELIYSDLL